MEPRLVTLMLLPLLLLQAVWNGVLGKNHSIHKRGLIELSGAIKCGTRRFPLMYLGYGCYCGPGGRGWPKDETDWCCLAHDCCYGFAEEQGCNPILRRYKWTCKENTVVCGLFCYAETRKEMSDWQAVAYTNRDDTVLDKCQKIICQCDREAAKCWRSARFNRHYAFWPNFLCGYSYPVCSYRSKWH